MVYYRYVMFFNLIMILLIIIYGFVWQTNNILNQEKLEKSVQYYREIHYLLIIYFPFL